MANLFTSQTPTVTDASEPGGITTASTVLFGVVGQVSGIRFYASATVSGTYTGALYQVTASDPGGTGTLLASKVGGTPTGGTWNTITFDTPVSVSTGIPYRAELFSGDGHYVATVGFWASQLVNGDITGPQAGTVNGGFNINQGTFTTGGALAYATLSSGSACYFVDVVFTAGSGGDKTTAAAVQALAALGGTSTITITSAATFSAVATLAAASTDPEVLGMGAVYTTRERVMRAADIKASAYLNAEVDLAIEAGARRIDDLCKRGDQTRPGFAPWTGTLSFDWPSATRLNESSFRLTFGQNALTTLSAVTSGGTAVTTSAYGTPLEGPPYDAIALDRGANLTLDPGDAAGQRSTTLTGVWCGCVPAESTRSAWTLGATVTGSAGTLTLNAPFGVGQIVRLDSERLIVTDRAWSASGQTGTLAAQVNAQTLAVSNGAAFFAGEELILDAERMLVRDIAGNNLLVQRAVGGSTLAAHTSASIMWSRTALCERGALGTTAAAHTSGAQVYFYKPPNLIEQLNVAYALDQRQQESSAYARTVGSGDSERQASGRSIKDLEKAVIAAYGRAKVRMRSV